MEYVNCSVSHYDEFAKENDTSEDELKRKNITVENIKNEFLWYENITQKGNIVYPNIRVLLEHKTEILKKENAIIYFVNSSTGFGSQLTIFIHYMYFIHKRINPKIHCLPHFGENKDCFQYHEESMNNSFFLYFRYVPIIEKTSNIFYVRMDSPLNQYFGEKESLCPFFHFEIPENNYVNNYSTNMEYSSHFKSKFQLRIGGHIHNYIDDIRDLGYTLIGIHVRTLANIIYSGGEKDVTINDILIKLRNKLNKLYGEKYDIFLATDVNSYIDIVKTIFVGRNVYYNKDITRMDYDQIIKDDQILLLDSSIMLRNYKGYKLGSDILYDCLALTLCDEFYVRKSNIAFITSFVGNNINGKRYI
jgi:hypothetical protein